MDVDFTDLQKCSRVEDLAEWLFHNADMLYENGRKPYPTKVPEVPTWRFSSLAVEHSRYMERQQRMVISFRFNITGNDPYDTIRRMFDDTGLQLSSMRCGWHDFSATVQLSAENWGPLFVRRRLEQL